MSRSITIYFERGADGGPNFQKIHRFQNYAEELSLSLKRSELGDLPMAEVDTATTHVRIVSIRKRHLRRFLVLIDELLEKHLMMDEADVRVDESGDASHHG